MGRGESGKLRSWSRELELCQLLAVAQGQGSSLWAPVLSSTHKTAFLPSPLALRVRCPLLGIPSGPPAQHS